MTISRFAVEQLLPRAVRAEQLQPYRELEDGITASSLQDAQDIVRQIQRDLAASSGSG